MKLVISNTNIIWSNYIFNKIIFLKIITKKVLIIVFLFQHSDNCDNNGDWPKDSFLLDDTSLANKVKEK